MLKNVRNSDLSLIKHQLDYNMWTLFSEFLAPDDKTRYLSDLILHTKQGYYFLIQAFAPYGTYRHFHAPLDTSAYLSCNSANLYFLQPFIAHISWTICNETLFCRHIILK